MIKYDLDSTASYTGGVAGLAPDDPPAGKALKDNDAAVAAYDKHADQAAGQIFERGSRKPCRGPRIDQTFTDLLRGRDSQGAREPGSAT